MNDFSPLPAHDYDVARWPRRYQRVHVVLGQSGTDEVDDDPRLAAVLSEGEADTEAFGPDLAGDQASPEEYQRVWTEAGSQQSLPFSMRALQAAVIANGAALVALALVMAGPNDGSKAGLMASAIVLALGLAFAAISVIAASLDFRDAQLRFARAATSSRLATISGAVAYGALVLAAVPLI